MLYSLPNQHHLLKNKLFPLSNQYHHIQVAKSLVEDKKLDILVGLCSLNVGKCSTKLLLLPRAFLDLLITIYLSLEQHSFADAGGNMHFIKKLLQLLSSAHKISLAMPSVSKFLPLSVFSYSPFPRPLSNGSFPSLLCPFRLDDQSEFFFSSLLSSPSPNPSLPCLTP